MNGSGRENWLRHPRHAKRSAIHDAVISASTLAPNGSGHHQCQKSARNIKSDNRRRGRTSSGISDVAWRVPGSKKKLRRRSGNEVHSQNTSAGLHLAVALDLGTGFVPPSQQGQGPRVS